VPEALASDVDFLSPERARNRLSRAHFVAASSMSRINAVFASV
jgi:hypothetical protein